MKKTSKKENRAHKVLIGFVELYIKLGKPIGSNTLKEHGFEEYSSATLRNYFAELETKGYLKQTHTSGGRIPTEAAYKVYAEEASASPLCDLEDEEKLTLIKENKSKNLTTYLHYATDILSAVTGCATFLTSVRFDHDIILKVKFLDIDPRRCLCVLITDFGQVFTEVLFSEKSLNASFLRKIEAYFMEKLKGQKEEDHVELSSDEEIIAQKFYNEIMIRYIVRYSNFSEEEIYRTGFSKLLAYPEFNDPLALTTGLSLFENCSRMRMLLNDCTYQGCLKYWIGSDLSPYSVANSSCAILAIPYKINQMVVGAIGLLGPYRIAYRRLFGCLQLFSESISIALTKSFYKHKLSFRHPRSGSPYLKREEKGIIDQTGHQLLEVKE